MQAGLTQNSLVIKMVLMKILLIDDHELFRDGLLLMLEGLQVATKTFEASSYEAAKIILDETSDFNLVLLDLDLPGINFFDALQALHQQIPDTPIVILSGTEDQQVIERALSLGASGYIPKSAPAKTMLKALQQVINGETYTPDIGSQNRTKNQFKNKPAEHKLTPRQLEVLIQLAEGKSNKEIGKALTLTESTVRAHVAAILRSFDVSNRTQAVRFAVQNAWVSVEISG